VWRTSVASGAVWEFLTGPGLAEACVGFEHGFAEIASMPDVPAIAASNGIDEFPFIGETPGRGCFAAVRAMKGTPPRAFGPWLAYSRAPDEEPWVPMMPRFDLFGSDALDVFVVTTSGTCGPRPYQAVSHRITGLGRGGMIGGLNGTPLRAAFCVDVMDGSRRAVAGVELEIKTDVDFIVRREDGFFEPAPATRRATLKTDESGRIVGYAARVPRSLHATWTIRSAGGSSTASGSTGISGSEVAYMPLTVR
jgi:hypothetical protein